jgi:K+/H+ antiporter YhaU regulatory subunit KhtT
MNIKVAIQLCICFSSIYIAGSLRAAALKSQKPETEQQVSKRLKERLVLLNSRMANVLQEQDEIKKKIAAIDTTIAATMQRQKELESIGITEEEIQVSILLEVSRLEAECRKLEGERTGLIEQLADRQKQADAIIKEIGDVVAQERDSDIIAIARQHELSVPWDGKLLEMGIGTTSYKDIDLIPKPFNDGKAEIVQLPALGQARSVDEHTNYCGYYTVYNTVCLLRADNMVDALLARAEFSEMFFDMLRNVKSKRKSPPYDNLAEDEIEDLLRMQKVSSTEYVCVEQKSLGGPCDFTDISRGIEASGQVPEAYKTIEAFKTKRTNNLVVIFNVGGKGAHWVAIQVQRHRDGVIRFMVVDSLNMVNWKEDRIIEERLVPLYNFVQ